MSELETEFLFEMKAELSMEFHHIGDSGRGDRRIAEVTGGTFEGPHLLGEVLPFGADFLVSRTDSALELDLQVILRTHDGVEIYARYPGLQHQASLGPLGELPPGERYFRSTPRFETGAAEYSWLNRILAVGVYHPSEPGTVLCRVFAVL